MKVKYIYSACIEVECNGFRILTDPWFTDGAYDGTWYQYPKINPFDFHYEERTSASGLGATNTVKRV